MVDIHLLAHGSEVHSYQFPLLMYKGYPYVRSNATPDGDLVDYHSTELGADTIYYFKPSGEFVFVDLDGLDDAVTLSNDEVGCSADFRIDVVGRDGSGCVFTRDDAEDCDAAHLIPGCKGDDYIRKVVKDRSPLYGPVATISGIDAIENGILLTKTLHSKFSRGAVAFIKTPNVIAGLDHTDIQSHLEKSPRHRPLPDIAKELSNLGTLASMVAFGIGASVDAVFQGTLPPAFILDYMYGVSAYKMWGTTQGRSVVESYYLEHYAQIPLPPRWPSSDSDSDPPDGSDNPTKRPPRKFHVSARLEQEMAESMDEVNLVLMLLQKGITLEEAIDRRAKEEEEEELKAQEASRSKVMDWMDTADVGDS